MDNKVSKLDDGCIFTLKYFGIFKYPLTVEEIHEFNPFPATFNETKSITNQLVSEGKVFQSGIFFALVNNPEWFAERPKGNKRAYNLLSQSKPYVSVIASFPFVRGIAFSGSLSKFYASESADMDYFIITEVNGLWIARSLLHLFKKFTFITGHQHFYCMNYFVDEQALSITHQNYYSAVELATLLPAFNDGLVKSLMKNNIWMKTFLPNHPGIHNDDYLLVKGNQPIKRFFESIFNLFSKKRFNRFLMTITDRKWRKKWKKAGYDMAHYDKALLTTTHISKNHPVDYEKIVMVSMEENKTHQPA